MTGSQTFSRFSPPAGGMHFVRFSLGLTHEFNMMNRGAQQYEPWISHNSRCIKKPAVGRPGKHGDSPLWLVKACEVTRHVVQGLWISSSQRFSEFDCLNTFREVPFEVGP
jgi:hypothetical protein